MSAAKGEGKHAAFAGTGRVAMIRGEEHPLREMTLREKIRVVGPLGDLVNEALRAVGLKRSDGGVRLEVPEGMTLGDLGIGRLLMMSMDALPEILRLSVPSFDAWDELSESETREVLREAMELNDFGGFVRNFISLGTRALGSKGPS